MDRIGSSARMPRHLTTNEKREIFMKKASNKEIDQMTLTKLRNELIATDFSILIQDSEQIQGSRNEDNIFEGPMISVPETGDSTMIKQYEKFYILSSGSKTSSKYKLQMFNFKYVYHKLIEEKHYLNFLGYRSKDQSSYIMTVAFKNIDIMPKVKSSNSLTKSFKKSKVKSTKYRKKNIDVRSEKRV